MGCCASTRAQAPPPSHLHRHSSRAPPSPHPLLEEETVKEVLSETPTPKPTINIPKIQDINEAADNKKPSNMIPNEEISEASEICSTFSESVTEKRDDDDDGEVRQRVNRSSPAKYRPMSFSGELSARRERVVGKPLARKSDQSPGRVKSVPGRERRGLVAGGQRRESGESSGRRSRSPATRTEGGTNRCDLVRSPSARRTGKSPARVRSEVPEKNRKVEAPTTNESLENPLVSLECFIFL